MAKVRKKQSSGEGALVVSPDAVRVPSELASQFGKYARKYAESASGLAGAGWGFISTKGGHFTYKQQQLDDPLKVVILGYAFENTYYDGPFDSESTAPPKCTAIGDDAALLAPPATWPTRESQNCRECWANAWGSGRGRGKACSNRVRLVVLPIYRGVNIEKEDGARLRVPPTSLPNFNKLLNEMKALNDGEAPTYGYLTAIGLEDDPKTMFKMTFQLAGALPEAMINQRLLARIEESQAPLLQVFDPAATVEETNHPKKRGGPVTAAKRR